MSGLFSLDSRFMRYMGRLADLMVLNLLFLLTSIPIVTVGASLTALYAVCFRLGTEEEGSVIRDYFRAFRANFLQATGLWLLEILLVGSSFLCAVRFGAMSGGAHYLMVVFVGLCTLAVLVFSYVFPLVSRFENSMMGELRNAFLLCIGYLPKSIVMGALNVFPFFLLLTDLFLFLKISFLWVILWFSTVCYINCQLLKKVFAPYLGAEENPL